MRHNMITASDVATALNVNKYETPNRLIKKKLNLQNSNSCSIATCHGNKYEDEARLLFSKRYNLETWEIGLFQHPEYAWLGGSPDGIAENGYLIEIKCPLTREITHSIPEWYYPQVQICMEILNRPACYFIQYKPETLFQTGILDVKIIPRNKDWFLSILSSLQNFWKKVLYFRENGYHKFDPKTIIDLSDLLIEGIKNIDELVSSDDEMSEEEL